MAVMNRTIVLIRVVDGADFDRVLSSHAFGSDASASRWGQLKRDAFRAQRKREGEKDQAFIDAIEYTFELLPFED